MSTGSTYIPNRKEIEEQLDAVRALMASVFEGTPLHFLSSSSNELLGSGKMLRARIPLYIGVATGVPFKTRQHAAAAAEMIHAASLLHDDVIDGGLLRRGAPAFWVERGVSGAILLGDTLLFKALDIICQVENSRLAQPLSRMTGEVCQAEVEQELISRGREISWSDCVRIARQKTGALFAFTAYASAGSDAPLQTALEEAGYLVGTAYQLADDVLDARGSPESAGKTLGTDSARAKNTAMTFLKEGVDPEGHIRELCASASRVLAPWSGVRQAWDAYMERDLMPEMEKNLRLICADAEKIGNFHA